MQSLTSSPVGKSPRLSHYRPESMEEEGPLESGEEEDMMEEDVNTHIHIYHFIITALLHTIRFYTLFIMLLSSLSPYFNLAHSLLSPQEREASRIIDKAFSFMEGQKSPFKVLYMTIYRSNEGIRWMEGGSTIDALFHNHLAHLYVPYIVH